MTRKVNNKWKKQFSEVGLSPSHAYLIRLVLANPGLSQQAIADELNLEKSTITRFVDKMEQEGYINRTISASRNTREQNIYPTEKAIQIQDQLEAISNTLYATVLDLVGESELQALVQELRRVGTEI
ncbi:MAG: MarR family transcriptional regulator [Chloroflexota bacterium]